MSLVINHNLMATQAARNLRTSFADLSTSVSRLSSGLRITSAADDAAGLAIRELMRADITSLNQGIRNANDAISAIQTADGALSVIDEKLIRMKELAMQASTGTYTSDQRLIIDSEYQAMASEITRIANATDFNGLYLLNGNLSGDHSGSGLQSTGKMKIHFGTANDSAEDYYYIQINSATASALGITGSASVSEYSGAEMEAFALSLQSSYPSYNDDSEFVPFFFYANVAQQDFNSTGKTFDADAYAGSLWDSATNRYVNVAQATDGSLWYNVFDNTAGTIVESVQLFRAAPSSAGSISTQQLAQQALNTIQNAIVSKDNIRANLGALQNRLENTISNLEIQSENLQAAESRISDVDVSLEMTNFVRKQILTQAAIAMLSQANSLPRMAMQLLGG